MVLLSKRKVGKSGHMYQHEGKLEGDGCGELLNIYRINHRYS
jgi:hypothetical protein